MAGDCVVHSWECGQARAKAMVREAGRIPGRDKTGDAGAGAPRGHRMWPVGLGILEEQVRLI